MSIDVVDDMSIDFSWQFCWREMTKKGGMPHVVHPRLISWIYCQNIGISGTSIREHFTS